VLGAGRVRRWLHVELPMLAPGLAAAGGLVMLSVLKELPATLLLSPPGFNTLATRVSGAMEQVLLVDAGELSLVLVGLSGALTWLLVVRRLGVTAPRRRRGR
jgi:iron(III) transport system permease protein